MSAEWNFYFCFVEDKIASIFVDTGLIGSVPIAGLGVFGYVRLYMRHPRPDGLSSSEEFDRLGVIDDALSTAMIRGGACYPGRNTSDGTRDFYFFVKDGARFEAEAAQVMAQFPEYEVDIGYRDDPECGAYRNFLYPSDRAWQTIRNRGVLEALEEAGDAPEALRQIDHWAYFPELSAANLFATFAVEEGFNIYDRHRADDGKYLVRCDRVDRPSEIDDVTLPLYDRAVALGGSYDGWECPVIPASS
jgi:regulator of RNase E activity RraB